MALNFGTNLFAREPELEEEDPHEIKKKKLEPPPIILPPAEFSEPEPAEIPKKKLSIRPVEPLFAPGKQLINYDYFDIANGVGYDVYYGARGTSGATLVTTVPTIYSEWLKSGIASGDIANSFTKLVDEDFDITFNTPKNIKGDLIINVPVGVQNLENNEADVTFYVTVTAKHYDGTTETELGSGQSVYFHAMNMDWWKLQSHTALIKINLSEVQHFKKGEILRFTIEAWFKNTAPSEIFSAGIAHDPANRNDRFISGAYTGGTNFAQIIEDGQPTTLTFHVPFVIDV
ncbi:MAG: hypothetical protein ACTSR1_01085 [Candidatus Heimdallarchaeota archaeon]